MRTAQRAYRTRQIDKLNGAEKKIKELETTVQNMANAVICLHDKIIRSETLSQDTHAMNQLQITMQICLQSMRTSDTAEDENNLAPHRRDQG
jgi:wobble nucleotide-excising tRNase